MKQEIEYIQKMKHDISLLIKKAEEHYDTDTTIILYTLLGIMQSGNMKYLKMFSDISKDLAEYILIELKKEK